MNWDVPGTGSSVGSPMYRWGSTDLVPATPKWRLINNAPSLTQAQRDARTNWVQGDMILLLPGVGEPQLQIRLDSGWKTVTLT